MHPTEAKTIIQVLAAQAPMDWANRLKAIEAAQLICQLLDQEAQRLSSTTGQTGTVNTSVPSN